MEQESVLSIVADLVAWWLLLALPAIVFVAILTLRGIREKKLPPNVNMNAVLMNVLLTWPKIYYLTILGVVNMASVFLLNRMAPMAPEEPEEPVELDDKDKEFFSLIQRRLNENRELSKWMDLEAATKSVDDEMGFIVDKDACMVYVWLFKNPEKVAELCNPDDLRTHRVDEKLALLRPWMVYDLVTAHPQLKEHLPPHVVDKLKVGVRL